MSEADKKRGRKALAGINLRTFGDQAEARTYLDGLNSKPADGAIKQYLDGGWRDTNLALRAGKPADGVDEIDAAMIDLPDDLLLRRQVPLSLFANVDPSDLVGMKMRDAAYASTSLDVGPSAGGKNSVTMHMLAPKGTKAYGNAADGEILLARDTEVAITRAEPDGNGGWDMYGVVLPNPVKRASRKSAKTTPAADSPTFGDRVSQAASGPAALTAPPLSLVRTDTHAKPGNRAGLPVAPREALSDYRDSAFLPVNTKLRGGETLNPRTDDMISGIDAAMAGSKLPGDVVTWRGLRTAQKAFGDRLDSDMTGLTWREDAYVSSSADRTVADDFIGKRQGGVRMRLLTPAGVGAVQLSADVDGAGRRDESELLLDRGLSLTVAADHGIDADGVRNLDVEVLAPTS
jgi:hypothetical protein